MLAPVINLADEESGSDNHLCSAVLFWPLVLDSRPRGLDDGKESRPTGRMWEFDFEVVVGGEVIRH